MTPGYFIRILDSSEVRADVAEHVLGVADRAAAALDLPHAVEVLLFRECAAGHPGAVAPPPAARAPDGSVHAGFHVKSMPGSIFVFADMSADRLERVIAHELRHDWQDVHNHDGRWDDGDTRERDAIEYARAWLGAERYAATEET